MRYLKILPLFCFMLFSSKIAYAVSLDCHGAGENQPVRVGSKPAKVNVIANYHVLPVFCKFFL